MPVILGAVAAALTAYRLRQPAGYVAAVMIAAGKATWKLLAAADIADLPRLADALFPLMGCGFVLLAAAAWGLSNPAVAVICCAAAALGVAIPSIADGFLVAAIVGVTALFVALGRDARRARDTPTVALLACSLLATYALGPMSSGEQTMTAQWIEQSINSAGQAAFALAAWRLLPIPTSRRETTNPRPPSAVGGS
uniref:hypothetical protein n=1 Tax=Gordonia sp. B7-2 TaxID=3420932 RepID=UPI003D930D88